MKAKLSENEKLILIGVFREWVAPRMASYVEPTREGTPKGKPIGLSRKKFYCANVMALYFRGAFTLVELAHEAKVSHEQLRNWRSETEFKKVAKAAFFAFQKYINEQAMECIEDWDNRECEKYLVWLKLFKADYELFRAKLLNKLYKKFTKNGQNIPSLIEMLKYLCALDYNFDSLNNPSVINIGLTILLITWLLDYIVTNTPMDINQKKLLSLLIVKLAIK